MPKFVKKTWNKAKSVTKSAKKFVKKHKNTIVSVAAGVAVGAAVCAFTAGMGCAVGGAIAAGIVERTTRSKMSGKSWSKSLRSGFNPKAIAFDAATGGAFHGTGRLFSKYGSRAKSRLVKPRVSSRHAREQLAKMGTKFRSGRMGVKLSRLRGKASRGTKLLRRSCNSFDGATRVRMGDGSVKAISQVKVGDEVTARDPVSGVVAARAVTDVIVGDGQKHLVSISIRGPNGDTGTIAATEGHPFWVAATGAWVQAGDLHEGQVLTGADGDRSVVVAVAARTETARVYNLTVDGVHTYDIVTHNTDTTVHNESKACSSEQGGIYVLEYKGKKYVGQTKNYSKRLTSRHRIFKEAKKANAAAKIELHPMSKGSTRLQRRIAEQAKINELGGKENLHNRINSIRKAHWKDHGIKGPPRSETRG